MDENNGYCNLWWFDQKWGWKKKQLLAFNRKVLHRYTVAGWSILKQISQSYCRLVLTDWCYCINRCRFCYPFQETVVKKRTGEKKPTCIYKVNIHFTLWCNPRFKKKNKNPSDFSESFGNFQKKWLTQNKLFIRTWTVQKLCRIY